MMPNYVLHVKFNYILKVWHGDQWIVKYVWKLTLLSIVEKEDHCTDLYIYLIQNNLINENKSEWVGGWVCFGWVTEWVSEQIHIHK